MTHWTFEDSLIVIVTVCRGLETVPAEIVLTLHTGHVVAPLILDYHHVALGTVLAIFTEFPLLKHVVFLLATLGVWVLIFATLNAHPGTTLAC